MLKDNTQTGWQFRTLVSKTQRPTYLVKQQTEYLTHNTQIQK